MLKKAIVILFVAIFCLPMPAPLFAESAISDGTKERTPSGVPLAELESFVDGYMNDFIGTKTVGASVMIVQDQKVVLSKGYGYADLENKVPADPQSTVFEWGSISKLTVWTAVMQLAEQGKIDLNADIQTYLPARFLTKLKYDEPITMLNLMNHNAGFEEYMFDMSYESPRKIRSLEEGLKLAEPAQVYKPGEVVAYSNYSTSLAAYIVERLAGQSFDSYASEHIFAKLGMSETTAQSSLADRPDLIARKAKGYVYAGESSFSPSSWNYMSMYPSGGINGTAADLAKFALAFLAAPGQPSLLFNRPDTLNEMLATSYSANADMPGVAHGFWEFAGEQKGIGHGGNTIAFSSNVLIVPEDRFAVVIMTNQASETDIVYGLRTALAGKRKIAAGEGDMPSAKELEGSYVAARRPHYGFMSVYPYLMLCKILPVSDNQIRVSLAGMTADYVQTKPYLYEKANGNAALDSFPVLYFRMEQGKVAQISAAYGDYLPLPAGKSMPILISSAMLAAFAMLYLLLVPLVLPIRAYLLAKRQRTAANRQPRLNKAVFWMTLSGAAMVVNNLVLALRMLSNNERAYSEIYVHILLNDILTGLAVAIIGFALILWKKIGFSPRQALCTILSIAVMIIWISLLIIWQFYR
ncbi:serine hydrolase [Cohnella sp. REN36]|uniref:serine hydrolase domain-containing protein n=1 Tax=Cohnella sp. REN36 TaxID=2887347 RepID=UPI001D1387F6|nr:serine hydrolase domain-containing protein [Cohnella sp. REN36]MCC3373702.1 beta-lactamase family protein [Cohnella sp. REN36]